MWNSQDSLPLQPVTSAFEAPTIVTAVTTFDLPGVVSDSCMANLAPFLSCFQSFPNVQPKYQRTVSLSYSPKV